MAGGLPQRTDDTGDVGIEARQQRLTCTTALGDYRVDRADGLGQGVDNIQVRQDRLLVGHGHTQPGPDGPGADRGRQLVEQGGQGLGLSLAALVGPAAQAQSGVGGAMQDRRQRVTHRPTDDGGAVLSHSSSFRRCRSPRCSCSTR
mgnify:CR=1 FL=1